MVATSTSVVFSSVPGVFWVVRWSMLEKVPGVTTLWGGLPWKTNLPECWASIDMALLTLCSPPPISLSWVHKAPDSGMFS
jgi:hypothetical protein